MTDRQRRLPRAAFFLALALGAAAPAARAQAVPAAPRPLSLEEALRVAEAESEQVELARAAVLRARGEQLRARSERLPQLYGSAAYTRTLASEFQGFGGGTGPDTVTRPQDCSRLVPDPALPLEQRVRELERAVRCTQTANPFAIFQNLPFGRENAYRLGLSVSQNVFTGGRVAAQNRIASAGRTVAEIGLASARAELALQVTEAYYDALLAERLLDIAVTSLAQTEGALRQAELARRVGTQPEFELLRARVARDNARPVAIQRRSDRDLALLRLRQLLNLPAGQPLELTSGLDEEALKAPLTRFASREALPDTTAPQRAPVRQAAEAVEVQEGVLRISRAQRLPSLSLSSQYGRVAYPSGLSPAWDDFRSNWTVTAALQLPLFTGGRVRGDELVAEAGVAEARARLRQAEELALLDTRSARERLEAAQASWEASSGTSEQAGRAYRIAEIRYREGLSTQLELNDARLLLQQAQANRAFAARELLVARTRLALIRDLPLGVGGGAPRSAPAQQPRAQQAPRSGAADPTQTLTGAGFP